MLKGTTAIWMSFGRLILASIGGVFGAFCGAGIWVVFALVFNSEALVVALAVGVLAALGVLLFGKRVGILYRMISVLAALTGLVVAKYAIFFFLTKRQLIEQNGQEAWDKLGWTLTSKVSLEAFILGLPGIIDGRDIIYALGVILVAWGVVNRNNLLRVTQPLPPPQTNSQSPQP